MVEEELGAEVKRRHDDVLASIRAVDEHDEDHVSGSRAHQSEAVGSRDATATSPRYHAALGRREVERERPHTRIAVALEWWLHRGVCGCGCECMVVVV